MPRIGRYLRGRWRTARLRASLQHGPHRRGHGIGADARLRFEHRRIAHRDARRAQAPDPAARGLGGRGGDLGAEAGGLHRFVHHQQSAGAARRMRALARGPRARWCAGRSIRRRCLRAASASQACAQTRAWRLQLTSVRPLPRAPDRAPGPAGSAASRRPRPARPTASCAPCRSPGRPTAAPRAAANSCPAAWPGQTTTTPGRCANQASSDCECCAAEASQMPIGMRATSGTRPWPPNMKRFFAAWLTISSMPHRAKSTTRISTTGRRPASAMPTPAPMMAASLIGVSITRCAPKRCCSPAYWPKMPPRPTSSPSTTTLASALHFALHGQHGGLRVADGCRGWGVRCSEPCAGSRGLHVGVGGAGVGPGRGVAPHPARPVLRPWRRLPARPAG